MNKGFKFPRKRGFRRIVVYLPHRMSMNGQTFPHSEKHVEMLVKRNHCILKQLTYMNHFGNRENDSTQNI